VNTVWHIAEQQFELHRYPKGQHDKSLQAWDSADEYLVQHCLPLFEQETAPSLLIANDQFGALSLAFAKYSPTLVTDSYISQLAIEQNSALNQVEKPNVIDSISPWPNSQFVLIRLTKNIGYLEFQLEQISQLTEPCQIIASGKTTLVTSNVLKLFEKYLTNVSTSLAKKKSRLIFANHSGVSQELRNKYPTRLEWSEKALTVLSHANVFAKDQIDIGGRFLADNLPVISENETVIDLGCGNGLLGLSCLQQLEENAKQASIIFTDESFMAVASAKQNVELNFPSSTSICQFRQDDCITQQPQESADTILCNPPFHQQNTITEHIAKQMFTQAFDCLKPGGQLLVVANRHLPYQTTLKKLFGGFTVFAQNSKFIIYQCLKNK